MKMLPKSKLNSVCKSSKERNYSTLSLAEINQQLSENNSTLFILEEYKHDYEVLCHCYKCKQVYRRSKRAIVRGSGCPVCANRMIIVGYNDISTTSPEIIKYLADTSDAYRYSSKSRKSVLTKCPNCGNERLMSICHIVDRGFSCPCTNYYFSYFIAGINDIAAKAPWMVKYLVDKNDAHKYSISSPKRIFFKCPVCGDESKRSVAAVHTSGLICQKCNDGISYPNKFSRALLDQLPVANVEYEFVRDWTQRKMYDNYFEYKGQKYILEMDGGFHFMDNTYTGTSVEVARQVDSLKEKLAIEHGIKVIRIDCRNASIDILKEAIIHSELNAIFDLSKIDWIQCEINARKNILLEVCKEYAKNELLIYEIAKKYHVSTTAVVRYKTIGKRIGLIPSNDNSRKRTFKIQEQRKKIFGKIYNSLGIYILDFSSYADATRKLRNKYPEMIINESRVRNAIKNNKNYKGFTFTVNN